MKLIQYAKMAGNKHQYRYFINGKPVKRESFMLTLKELDGKEVNYLVERAHDWFRVSWESV